MTIASSVYNPPKAKEDQKTLQELYPGQNIRRYSLARFALKEGLKAIGLNEGDTVLIPELICRDILSSFHELGIQTEFYKVDRELNPNLENLPEARAIMAVDYFGFPQDITPFKEWCEKNNGLLIEDNAHGFLSASSGEMLGTRGDLGIISIRKSIPLPNGGLLLTRKNVELPGELEINSSTGLMFDIKNTLRPLFGATGGLPVQLLTGIWRTIKGDSNSSSDEMERSIPGEANACDIDFFINQIDINEEIKRRRGLYKFLEEVLQNAPVEKIFSSLPDDVVPYGFCFRCQPENVEAVRKMLTKHGLECNNWPDLPNVIAENAPTHYKNIWIVRFLW